jgi:hypothetical protein
MGAVMEYPPLPFPPNATIGEALHHYGIRLLMFVVDTNITATMSDIELELAHYVVPFAFAQRGKDGTDLIVVERVRAAAHLIMLTLIGRRKAEEAEAREATQPIDGGVEGGAAVPNAYAPLRNPQPPVEKVDWDEVRKLFQKDKSFQDYIGKVKDLYPERGDEWMRRLRQDEIPMDKPGDKIRF